MYYTLNTHMQSVDGRQLPRNSVTEQGRRNVIYVYHNVNFILTAAGLYERALCDCPLETTFWSEYLEYMNKLRLNEKALEVGERAVKNCPWDLSIWTKLLHIAEKLSRNGNKPKGNYFFVTSSQNHSNLTT